MSVDGEVGWDVDVNMEAAERVDVVAAAVGAVLNASSLRFVVAHVRTASGRRATRSTLTTTSPVTARVHSVRGCLAIPPGFPRAHPESSASLCVAAGERG